MAFRHEIETIRLLSQRHFVSCLLCLDAQWEGMIIVMKKAVIMIPCYKPDEKFLIHVDKFKKNGFDKIIVINDGNGESYEYIVNKKFVFHNKGDALTTAVKFFALCVVRSTCSGFMTKGLVNWNEVLCKIIIDTILFFVSFQIQNRWVFKSGNRVTKDRG